MPRVAHLGVATKAAQGTRLERTACHRPNKRGLGVPVPLVLPPRVAADAGGGSAPAALPAAGGDG